MAAANNMHASAGTDTPANSDLSRIATALERIATAIEAQTESVELGFSMLSNRIEDLAGCIPGLPDWFYDEPPKAKPMVRKKKPQRKPREIKKPGFRVVTQVGEKQNA